MKTLILMMVLLAGCYEMDGQGWEAPGDTDTEDTDSDTEDTETIDEDTDANQDCETLCDVEAACASDDPGYHGWGYCMDDCEAALTTLEPALLECVFACAPSEFEATPDSCSGFAGCAAHCHGE